MADPQLIEQVNSGIEKGEVLNKAGGQVKEKLDGGILREDKKVLYPVQRAHSYHAHRRGDCFRLTLSMMQRCKSHIQF